MYKCRICRFMVELDDAIAPSQRGTCICLRCYLRLTDHTEHVTKKLRREIEEAMAA